ncbi:hypothetical protein FACS189487_02550 [Campylobacterota bacterium]|nr:hypothetical protein FACS189487_02550 [Campylobacterota bacterium]
MDQQTEQDKNTPSGFPDPETTKRLAINAAIGAIVCGLISWYISHNPVWAAVGTISGMFLGWAFTIGKEAVFGAIVGAAICAWGAKSIGGDEIFVISSAAIGLLMGIMFGGAFSEQKVKREMTAEEAIVLVAGLIMMTATFGVLFGVLIGAFITTSSKLTISAILNGAALVSDHIFIYAAAGAIAWTVLSVVFFWFTDIKKHLAHIGFFGTVGGVAIGAIVGAVSIAICGTAVVWFTCYDHLFAKKVGLLGMFFTIYVGVITMMYIARIRLKADSENAYKKRAIAIIGRLFIGAAIGAIGGAVLGAAIDWFSKEELSINAIKLAFLGSVFCAIFTISKYVEKVKEADRSASEN